MSTSTKKSNDFLAMYLNIHARNANATTKRKTKQLAGNGRTIYSRFTTCLSRVFRRTRIYYRAVHIYIFMHAKYNNNIIIYQRKHLEGKTRRARKTRPPLPRIPSRAGRVSGHTRRRRVVIFNPEGSSRIYYYTRLITYT